MSLDAQPVTKASLLEALGPDATGGKTLKLGAEAPGGSASARTPLSLDHAKKVQTVQDARSVLAQEEHRLHELQKQVAAGAPVDPKRLGFQEHEVSQAWAVLTEAEKRLDAAELKQERRAQVTASNTDAAVAQQEAAAKAAAARQVDEVRRGTRIVDSDLAARNEAQVRRGLEADEQNRRANQALVHGTVGKRRLKEAQDARNVQKVEAEVIRDERFNQDASRILNLKASIEKINNNVQASNERQKKKLQKKDTENLRRRNDLLEHGLNPYEVFRREDIEADKQRQIQETVERNALRSEKLLEQLMDEDKKYKKKIKQEKNKRADDEEFQRQMGNYARERRVVAYIKKMTIGNVEVLDPTGAAMRIDPSKVTVQRTHAFGLGKVSIDEIKKVSRDVQKGHSVLARKRANLTQGSDSEDNDAGQLETRPDLDLDVQSDAAPDGKLWVPKLTVLEQQYLAAARERQKQNMTSTQYCWGKEFKGDAFLAKPSVIAFDDFETGKKYRQIVEITNVSYTFNQFKLLPLDEKLKEFFDIQFVPPGRMSAGVTRFVTIWFHPKVSKDINTTFPILAKTGKIDFPMRCTTKKTILTITPQDSEATPAIDFGAVLDGEDRERVLSVKNTGALPASFTLETLEDPDGLLSEMVTYTCSDQEFTAHATTKIKFFFKPTRLGEFSAVYRLTLDNHAVGDASFAKEMIIKIKGSCTDVPIWVEKPEYDLKTCIFDHIFRDNIMVYNRQSTARKVIVESPKPIDGELQMTPTLAFIQGQSSQAIQVKFSPKEDFLDKHPEYRATIPGVQGAFRIPVKIVGADQALPVWTALIGSLSTSRVSFEPKSLNFGKCFVGSSTVLRVTLVNESTLPQDFALPRLPSFLSVIHVPSDVIEEERADSGNGDGGTAILEGSGSAQFDRLLPLERRDICVAYTPEAATEMKHKLSFKAITGSLCAKDYSISCKGQGVTPMLELSHSQVDMASIPCDVTSTESIAITNVSKAPMMMNLMVPPTELSCLFVSPVCSVLQPGESQQLQLEFKPTTEYRELLNPPERPATASDAAPDAAAADTGPDADADAKSELSPEARRIELLRAIRTTGGRRWETPAVSDAGDGGVSLGNTIHASWRLAIFMKNLSATSAVEEQKFSNIYLGVRTCVLPKKLLATPAVVDAGEVTPGQCKLIPVVLQNLVPGEPQDLQLEALPENSCFSVLNAPRMVTDKPFTLLVQFKPEMAPQIYQSALGIRTGNTRMQVPLSGRGVRPVLKIDPEDGILHLGSVVYSPEGKEFTTAKVELLNDSKFDLHFNLSTVIDSEQCHVGPSPFTLSPASGVVGPNGRREVTVTFRPHRPLELFREKVFVDVPMQKEKTFLYLYGHCFHYQAYCIPGMEFCPFDRSQVTTCSAFVDSLALGAGSGSSPTEAFSYAVAQRKSFSVVFEHGEQSKFILVGAGAPVGTNGITFDIQILPTSGGRDFSKYFTVEAPEGGKADKVVQKVALVSGKPAIKAVFRYNPPETTSLTCGGVDLDMLSGIGQWITCSAKCMITGGAVPAGSPATQEIMIELRAYLQQI